jgi:hypothetical protein
MTHSIKDPHYLHLINVVGLQRSYTAKEQRFIEKVLQDNQEPVSQRYMIGKALGL